MTVASARLLRSPTSSLSDPEYSDIVERLGREPNAVELGMLAAMWSEHCGYKSSRALLKRLPTTGPRVVQGPGENAGAVDIGDGLLVVLKMESHNHPSAVEPFQGAATGVGGILRDIFTMGARPVALLDSLRFGPLETGRNRYLFDGVVAGIGHYGNCLAADETFIWRDANGVHFDTIGRFVECRLAAGQATAELEPAGAVETLSLDLRTRNSCWRPVRRVFKRRTNALSRIRTSLGRSLTVTPDHPMLTLRHGQWGVLSAGDVLPGDQLPLLITLPEGTPPAAGDSALAIDLLALISTSDDLARNVYVALPPTWRPSPRVRDAMRAIEPSASNRHQYLTRRRMRLDRFLELEPLLGVSRDDVRVYRRGGRSNHMHAIIRQSECLARLLGYYLAEGCVSRNGSTDKVIFTFAKSENEYVEDVVHALRDLGLRPCVEQRSSTIAVTASSWLLGHLLRTVWRCGVGSADKAFPAIFFTWPQRLQRAGLAGLLRGDGSLYVYEHSPFARISFATASRTLHDQTMALLQNEGAMPSVYERPGGRTRIEGREVNCRPIWSVDLASFAGLSALTDVFDTQCNGKLARALSRHTSPQFSHPRYRRVDGVALVPVRSVDTIDIDSCDVYDVEVADTHLFATSSGIVTHNCIGVPTVGGEVYFHPSFSENPLVNAMCVGIARQADFIRARASDPGDVVLVVGAATGRDGIHGATFASAELDETREEQRPAVQVGNPFLEKLLLEACLDALNTGRIRAMQDLGAAGLTSSSVEVAARGGRGIRIDVGRVSRREDGMTPYDVMLSESQERMLLVVAPEHVAEVRQRFARWDLSADPVGSITDDGMIRVEDGCREVARLPIGLLTEEVPSYVREGRPAPAPTLRDLPAEPADLNPALLALLGSPNICSRRPVFRKYDHTVQANTVVEPGLGAAVVRIRGTRKALALTTDCNPRYCAADPRQGARIAVAEAARNLACRGAVPIAVTDCLNFGNPERPEVSWQLSEAIDGLAEACRALDVPIVSGNVSLYNETDGVAVAPSPIVGMVGLIEDREQIVGSEFREAGDMVLLLGPIGAELGCSEYLALAAATELGRSPHPNPLPLGEGASPLSQRESVGVRASTSAHNTQNTEHLGPPPSLNLDVERRVQEMCCEAARRGLLQSAHDCSEGGLAVTLAESCIVGDIGFEGDSAALAALVDASATERRDAVLFGEGQSRIVVSCRPEDAAVIEQLAAERDVPVWWLGRVGRGRFRWSNAVDLSIEELRDAWEGGLA